MPKRFHNTHGDKFAFFHFADVHWPYGYHKFKSNDEFNSLENFLIEQSRITGVPLSKTIKPGPIEAIKKDEELLLEQNYRMIIDYYCNQKDYNTVMQWYADGISRFDNSRFDEFIKSLKNCGLFDDPNTLIIIFGDHGENWSDESYGHFNSCDYGVINVPVLLHSKSIPRGDGFQVLRLRPRLSPDSLSYFLKIVLPRSRLLAGPRHKQAFAKS